MAFTHGVYTKKAFDTIGIEQRALKWFDSYRSDRQQKCLVNVELSDARAGTCGLPQRSLIGPSFS